MKDRGFANPVDVRSGGSRATATEGEAEISNDRDDDRRVERER